METEHICYPVNKEPTDLPNSLDHRVIEPRGNYDLRATVGTSALLELYELPLLWLAHFKTDFCKDSARPTEPNPEKTSCEGHHHYHLTSVASPKRGTSSLRIRELSVICDDYTEHNIATWFCLVGACWKKQIYSHKWAVQWCSGWPCVLTARSFWIRICRPARAFVHGFSPGIKLPPTVQRQAAEVNCP